MEPSIYDDNVLVGQPVGVLARVEDHQTMADAMVLLSQCFSFPLTFLLTLSDMVNWKYHVMGFFNVIHMICVREVQVQRGLRCLRAWQLIRKQPKDNILLNVKH
jgi:ABC-type antimicrobial peptide transport system permease subunit